MPEIGTSDLTATHVIFGSFPFFPERPSSMAADTACWTLSGRRSRDPGSTETNVQGSPQNLEDLPVERPREHPVLGLLILAVQFGIAVARLRSSRTQSHSSMRTASPSGIHPTAELDLESPQ
jgi:hypothetical protein